MTTARGSTRRQVLAAAAAAPLGACTRSEPVRYSGTWVGAQHERGHRFRDTKSGAWPAPGVQRRAGVLIVGAGMAGLAAARALTHSGIADVHVFDLEDAAGGNSRGHRMAGMACPLGAHYVPLPGEHATEVIALLEELGLRRTEHGRAVYDERHLCHSPQERIFIDGHWHEGLLPPVDALPAAERAQTLAQYRQFSAAVANLSKRRAFAMPTGRATWSAELETLDRITFNQWLDTQGLNAPALRWYLDYCCRDDYGAGAAQVSAWAGVHYFASRHGFHAPGAQGADDAPERDAVLTWPEGNAWLGTRLAAPLNAAGSERLHTGRVALRVDESRHDVSVEVWNVATGSTERWTAPHLILATPLFVSARLLSAPPAALLPAAALPHAPWLVANLQLDAPLHDVPGAPPSWDNVICDIARDAAARAAPQSLGYVDAMHQSTRPYAGPTVLTAYWALGGDTPQQSLTQRAALLNEPWPVWSSRVVQDLARAHPDLPHKVRQVDLMRYGHAMVVPAPGVRSHAALRSLVSAPGNVQTRRVHFAHSDLSGYSVFEEAMFHGARAAARIKSAL